MQGRKKILHILKTKPDDAQSRLIQGLCESSDCLQVSLFEGDVDYDRLVDLIFEYEQVITWW